MLRVEAYATDLTIASNDREIRGRVNGAGCGERGVSAAGAWARRGCVDTEHGESGTRANTVVGVDALVWILILKGTGDGGCGGDGSGLGGGRRYYTASPGATDRDRNSDESIRASDYGCWEPSHNDRCRLIWLRRPRYLESAFLSHHDG